MNIKLTAQDLQKIYDLALHEVKSTNNPALDSHLQVISCILVALSAHAKSMNICLEFEQPKPRNWQSVDDE